MTEADVEKLGLRTFVIEKADVVLCAADKLAGLGALLGNQNDEPKGRFAESMCGVGYILEGIARDLRQVHEALDGTASDPERPL